MRILFDQGTPGPLRRALTAHVVSTAYEMGWTRLGNGALLRAAEAQFDILVMSGKNIRHQQNVAGSRLAILVLPTTDWLNIRTHQAQVIAAVDALRAGDFVDLHFA